MKIYRGYLYEVYSHENKALLNYMRDGSVDFTNMTVSDVFSDWLLNNGYDGLYDQFNDEFFDADALASSNPLIADEFSEWLSDNSDELMRRGSSYTKAHMDLEHKRLLPRDTWLIHFSDNAYNIAVNGFTKGTSDISELGITRGGDGYPGYNFAFLANRIHDSEKYGEDAVMFQSSGVKVFHLGDDENQVIFYGPHVKELIYIKRYRDGELDTDHRSGRDYEYAIMSNTHLDRPIRRFRTIEDVVSFVKLNYRQYMNKIVNVVK